MYVLTTKQQKLLSIVLMEYFNVRDWKELFQQTDSEAFAQQHTHFYDDESWDNGSYEENLEKDCAEAVAFILNKNSDNLKVIWEMPGVKTMAQRKDENFHAEIEAIIERANNQVTNAALDSIDENQNPIEILDNAQQLLSENKTNEAFNLVHVALRNFLNQTTTRLEIDKDTDTVKNDSISVLQAKVSDYLKRQNEANLNNQLQTSSLLRNVTVITETIDDLHLQNQAQIKFNKADVKYMINSVSAMMIYIDALISDN